MQTLIRHKIIFRETHAELVEERIAGPVEDEVLIRSECSLISPGTERAALTRLWDDAIFRANPGYALVGRVEQTGSQVATLRPGERVLALAGHADLTTASADAWVTLPVPEDVSSEAATFVVLGSVALHAIHRARIQYGEDCLILGAGIIGLLALQMARTGGARRVIVLDPVEERLALASRLGADLALNPGDTSTRELVLEATGGRGPQVVLESAGNPQAVLDAFQMAAIGGRIVCVGLMEAPVTIRFHKEFIQHELELISAYQPLAPTQETLYWRWTQQANRRLLLEMLAEGKLEVEKLITHRVPAAQAPEFYERLKKGNAGMLGVMLNW